MNPTYLSWAVVNTLIAVWFLADAVVGGKRPVAAIPNGVVACIFWLLAFNCAT